MSIIKSIGDELNVVYAPSRFNISDTALIKNKIREWQKSQCRGRGTLLRLKVNTHIIGEFEGVSIRVLNGITWTLERRLPGSNVFEKIFEHTGTP